MQPSLNHCKHQKPNIIKNTTNTKENNTENEIKEEKQSDCQKWSCDSCTYFNDMNDQTCIVCYAIRPSFANHLLFKIMKYFSR